MGEESVSEQLSRLVQLNVVLRHARSACIPRWMKAIIKFLHVANGIIFLSERILDFVVVLVLLFFHLLHFSLFFLKTFLLSCFVYLLTTLISFKKNFKKHFLKLIYLKG